MRGVLALLLILPMAAALPTPDDAPQRFETPCLEDHARRFVYDYTGTLTRRDGDRIEWSHCQLYRTSGVHYVVILVDDDEGDIERLAFELFEEWGIGDAERLDGLLLLLHVADNATARLEVGYGLEEAINAVAARDALADGAAAFETTLAEGGIESEAFAAYIVAVDRAVEEPIRMTGGSPAPLTREWSLAPLFGLIGLFVIGGTIYMSRTTWRRTNEWGDVEPSGLDYFLAGALWREGRWEPDEGHAGYQKFRTGRKFRYISFMLIILALVLRLMGRRGGGGDFGGGRSGGGGGTGRF